MHLYSAFIQSTVHLYSAFIQSTVHLYSAFIQSTVHLYSAFIKALYIYIAPLSKALCIYIAPLSKALYIYIAPLSNALYNLCSFTHSPIHTPTSSSGAIGGIRCLAQGHFDTPRVGSNQQPSDCQTTALTSRATSPHDWFCLSKPAYRCYHGSPNVSFQCRFSPYGLCGFICAF